MALRQSRCFVLRTYPASEVAKLVVLFSEEAGKIKGWAHGARRPNSRFGSSLDLGNEVRVEWQERQSREWVTLRHGELLTSALPLVRDPVAAAALSHQIRLVDLFAPDRETNPDLYRLTGACLRALTMRRSPRLVTAYFEAWLLRLSGLYPRPGRCGCGADFGSSGAVFEAAGPAYFCPHCAAARGEADAAGRNGARLSGDALALLGDIWTSPPEAVADRPSVRELFRFHGLLTESALGRSLRTRAALTVVLGRSSAPAERDSLPGSRRSGSAMSVPAPAPRPEPPHPPGRPGESDSRGPAARNRPHPSRSPQ